MVPHLPRRFALLVLCVVPLLAALVVGREVGRNPNRPSDSGLFIGMAENLRQHGSLTAPSDATWLRLSPAETAARRGFIPVTDFAPLYPAGAALAPRVVTGFAALNLLGLVLLLGGAGLLAVQATGHLLAGVGLQVFLVLGPLAPGPFGLRVPLLNLAGDLASDGLAAGLLVAGLAAWGVAEACGDRRWAVAAAALLAGAGLTRFALAGALVGILVAGAVRWLWARRSNPGPDGVRGARSTAAMAGAALLPTAVWVVGYPLATSANSAKALAWHPDSMAGIGRVAAGWFGLEIGPGAVAGYVALAVVAAVALGAQATASVVAQRCGAALVGYLVLHIATRLVLDSAFVHTYERTLLPVRVLLLVLVVALLGQVRARTEALAALGAVGFLAVAARGPSTFVDLPPLGVDYRALRSVDVPIVSHDPDGIYAATRVPSVGLPQPVEPTTGRTNDIAHQAAELVGVLTEHTDQVLVVQGPTVVPIHFGRDQWPACAVPGPWEQRRGYGTYELDLSGC